MLIRFFFMLRDGGMKTSITELLTGTALTSSITFPGPPWSKTNPIMIVLIESFRSISTVFSRFSEKMK